MNVLLVDNLVMPEENSLELLDVHPHMGLLALAAVAERAGHTVQIYDPKRAILWRELTYDATIYERAAAEILSRRPAVVGFTTLGCSFLFALKVAAILKSQEPDLPILLGGPHATMLHRQILERFPQFDVVVRHEADEIFPKVLERLESRSFESIPGMSWRAANGQRELKFTEGKPKIENLDDLPYPSYDYYPVADLRLELLRIEAGRGCPFMCTFCSTASFFQRNFRLKSAARLVRELDILHDRYGYSHFKLDHDMFTVNRRKVVEFCEAVKGRKYRWRASARVDCVDADLLHQMADAGCVGLYFGIETGSPRMQEICQKRLDLALVQPTLEVCEKLGIETTASFITGYPEEMEEDHRQTLDFLGLCFRPTCLAQLHMLAPEPGTPMFEALGKKIEYDGYAGKYNAALLGADDELHILEHPDIFQTYYYYPAQLPRARYIFAVEVMDLFRQAGALVINYMLRAFGGRLSTVVEELRQFAITHESAEGSSPELIERYLKSKFGPQHHLVSLFRFALRRTADRPTASAPASEPLTVFHPSLTYQINPQVERLEDVHDCRFLLEQIARRSPGAPLLEEAEAGERGTYLILGSGGTATSCLIDPGIEALLSLFEHPRTCLQVASDLREMTGIEDLQMQIFEELHRTKLITAVPFPTFRNPARQELYHPDAVEV